MKTAHPHAMTADQIDILTLAMRTSMPSVDADPVEVSKLIDRGYLECFYVQGKNWQLRLTASGRNALAAHGGA